MKFKKTALLLSTALILSNVSPVIAQEGTPEDGTVTPAQPTNPPATTTAPPTMTRRDSGGLFFGCLFLR